MTRRIATAALLSAVFVSGTHRSLRAQGRLPEHTFLSAGATMHYSELGPKTGVPLVVLSGGPGFDYWYLTLSSAWRKIAVERRVVFLVQRGTGASAPVGPKDSVTIADFVADIDALRKTLGTDKIDLLGHSFGGYLAMAYAAKHGDRLAHFILMDSAAPKFSETLFLFAQAFPENVGWQERFAKGLSTGDTAAMTSATNTYMSMVWYSPANRDRFLKESRGIGFNRHQYNQLQRDMNNVDLKPVLASFNFPTLVITGRYDMNVAPLTAYQTHQAIRGSAFEVFERSSHMPFYEEPDRFAMVVGDFLRK